MGGRAKPALTVVINIHTYRTTIYMTANTQAPKPSSYSHQKAASAL